MRDVAHGILNTPAVLLELCRGDTDDAADRRRQHQKQQRELPVEVKNVGEQRRDRESFAHDHLDGGRYPLRDLLDVEGDQGEQLAGIALREVGRGEPVDVCEHIDTQSIDHLSRHVGDVVGAQVRADAAQGHDGDQGQRQGVAQGLGFIQTETRLPVARAARPRRAKAGDRLAVERRGQVLHQTGEGGLSHGVEHKAQHADQERRPQCARIAQQARVHGQPAGGPRGAGQGGIGVLAQVLAVVARMGAL